MAPENRKANSNKKVVKSYCNQRHIKDIKVAINKLEAWAVFQRADALGLSHRGTFDEVKGRIFRYETLKLDPNAPLTWNKSIDEKEPGDAPFTLQSAYNEVSYDEIRNVSTTSSESRGNLDSSQQVSEIRDIRLNLPNLNNNGQINLQNRTAPLPPNSPTPTSVTMASITTNAQYTNLIRPTFTPGGPRVASRIVGASTFIHEDPSGLRVNNNIYQGVNIPRMNVIDFYNQQYAPNYMNWRPPTSQFGSLNLNRPPITTNQNGDNFSWDYEDLGRLEHATLNMNRPPIMTN